MTSEPVPAPELRALLSLRTRETIRGPTLPPPLCPPNNSISETNLRQWERLSPSGALDGGVGTINKDHKTRGSVFMV